MNVEVNFHECTVRGFHMYITLTGHIHVSYITLDETFQQKIRLFDHLLCKIFHPKKTRKWLDDGHKLCCISSIHTYHTLLESKYNTQYNHNIPNCTAKTPMSAQWGPVCRRVTAWVYPQNGAHPPENAPMGGFLVFNLCSFWPPKPVIPPWALLRGLPVCCCYLLFVNIIHNVSCKLYITGPYYSTNHVYLHRPNAFGFLANAFAPVLQNTQTRFELFWIGLRIRNAFGMKRNCTFCVCLFSLILICDLWALGGFSFGFGFSFRNRWSNPFEL